MTKPKEILAVAYRDHYQELMRYSFSKVSDQALSEDLVQNTFMKTFVYLRRNQKIDVMCAFLYRVLNNLIVDEYRKHKSSSLDVLIEKGFEPKDDRSERFANEAIDIKSSVLLLEKLPERYHRVIKMRYLDEMSVKEISAATKESPNNVGVQVHRGLGMLRKLSSNVEY